MNTQRGFSILELMAIVAISATLVTVGLPTFQTMVFNNRVTAQLNLFSSSLSLARSEAAKVNQRVVVCPSLLGDDCDLAEDFNVGWIAFVDRGGTDFRVDDDGGGNPADDPCGPTAGDDAADDCILNYVPGLTNVAMSLKTNFAGNYISYNGLGASNSAAMFVICDERGAESAKAVVVSTTGRASVRKTNTDGSALACDPPF